MSEVYDSLMEGLNEALAFAEGWLIRNDDQMKALAANMGAIDDENSVQVSGVIQIPTRCVLHVTPMAEA